MNEFYNAKVEKVIENENIQIIKARLKNNTLIEFENDYIKIKEGQKIIIQKTDENYILNDIDRTNSIGVFTLLFIIAILFLSGKQGLKSICSLILSILLIIYALIPLILNGYNPIFVSVSITSFILFIAIFLTHGINKESLSAFLGTTMSIIFTMFLSKIAFIYMSFTGLSNDYANYLNIHTKYNLDFSLILLSAIIIGIIGVLDDIAITQAHVVSSLKKNNSKHVYKEALHIGKEHVGALVNTLALAYTGSSIFMIMYIQASNTGLNFIQIISQEIFATEILRIILGSIGLILTVPITTYIAYLIVDKKDNDINNDNIISTQDHSHSHCYHICK